MDASAGAFSDFAAASRRGGGGCCVPCATAGCHLYPPPPPPLLIRWPGFGRVTLPGMSGAPPLPPRHPGSSTHPSPSPFLAVGGGAAYDHGGSLRDPSLAPAPAGSSTPKSIGGMAGVLPSSAGRSVLTARSTASSIGGSPAATGGLGKASSTGADDSDLEEAAASFGASVSKLPVVAPVSASTVSSRSSPAPGTTVQEWTLTAAAAAAGVPKAALSTVASAPAPTAGVTAGWTAESLAAHRKYLVTPIPFGSPPMRCYITRSRSEWAGMGGRGEGEEGGGGVFAPARHGCCVAHNALLCSVPPTCHPVTCGYTLLTTSLVLHAAPSCALCHPPSPCDARAQACLEWERPTTACTRRPAAGFCAPHASAPTGVAGGRPWVAAPTHRPPPLPARSSTSNYLIVMDDEPNAALDRKTAGNARIAGKIRSGADEGSRGWGGGVAAVCARPRHRRRRLCGHVLHDLRPGASAAEGHHHR
jgi:hypothetical protein